MDFRLPELGEGITEATVVNIAVKVGDRVTSEQTLLEVETDKAAMPIPAGFDGVIEEVRVKPGQKVAIGQPLLAYADPAEKKDKEPTAKPAAAEKPSPDRLAPSPAPPSGKSDVAAAGERIEFKLPALGEGIEGGVIVSVAAKQGEPIAQDQELFTIETDKASMPIPSPAGGVLAELRVKPGDKVQVGMLVAVIAGSAAAKPASAAKAAPPSAADGKAATATAPPARAERGDAGNGQRLVPAGPATRRLARELGVKLHEVSGSARGGRVTIDDVKNHVRRKMVLPGPQGPAGAPAVPPLPDFSKYGPVDKKPITNIRRKIAENLTLAWHAAPAVTQYDQADITELEAGRKRTAESPPEGAAKITMTALAVKAVVAALREFPHVNSSLDLAAGIQVFKRYYHIGIAVDTERGLVVPVIRDADKKSIRDLAKDIAEMAEKARAGKLAIDEMRGGTFTITNLGGIGGSAFSPIINYPEVAILGLARSSLQAVVRDGKIEARLMLPLCLTYDHRVIDGAAGARFTARLVQLFSDPIRLLMES